MGLTCGTIPEIKRDNIDEVTRQFVGNSTRFKVLEPGVIEMQTDFKFKTTNQLYLITQQKIENKIYKWAEKTHGEGFGRGWLDVIDQNYPGRLIVKLKFPNQLENAYRIADEQATLDEINNAIFNNVGNDYYMDDELLKEQEEKNLEKITNISESELTRMMEEMKNRRC